MLIALLGNTPIFLIETPRRLARLNESRTYIHEDTENSSRPRTPLMITQRDTIWQEVLSVFRRRPKVIKNVKVRNKVSRDTKRGRRSMNRD